MACKENVTHNIIIWRVKKRNVTHYRNNQQYYNMACKEKNVTHYRNNQQYYNMACKEKNVTHIQKQSTIL